VNGGAVRVSLSATRRPSTTADLQLEWFSEWYPKGEVPLLLDNRVHMDTERPRVDRTHSSPVKTR